MAIEHIRAAIVRNFGLQGEILENYTKSLSKCFNEILVIQIIEKLAREFKGQKTPTAKKVLDEYFRILKNPDECNSNNFCEWCNNTGYVPGLYDYQSRIPIPNKQVPIPTLQIEKIIFACFCGHCQSKDLETKDIREKQVIKYGWDRNEADRFIGECCQLAQKIL